MMYSGGADGADLAWGNEYLKHTGDLPVHFSFSGHGSKVSKNQQHKLADDQLELANDHIIKASKSLDRTIDIHNKSYVLKLLQRNWWIVNGVGAVYAIGYIKFKEINSIFHPYEVMGGTAWGVQMAFDQGNIPVHLFDQNTNMWYELLPYTAIPKVPKNPLTYNLWAGIGSRKKNFTPEGLKAIQEIMNT